MPNDFYDIFPVVPLHGEFLECDIRDMRSFDELFRRLVLSLQQTTGSGGVHTHPGARLLIAAICLLINPKFAVETGSDAGVTTQAMAVSIRNGQLIAVENGSELRTPALDRYNDIVMNSFSNLNTLQNDALQFLTELPSKCINVIFLDDDHSQQHVHDEMIQIHRVLSPGGVAIFHDVTFFKYIEDSMRSIFAGWDMIILPALSPTRLTRDGVVHNVQWDMGIGVVRKPQDVK